MDIVIVVETRDGICGRSDCQMLPRGSKVLGVIDLRKRKFIVSPCDEGETRDYIRYELIPYMEDRLADLAEDNDWGSYDYLEKQIKFLQEITE